MKTTVCLFLVMVASGVVLHAQSADTPQSGAFEAAARSQRIARENLERAQQQIRAEQEAWRTSTKLTLLEKVPDRPRDRPQCLTALNLRDHTAGYLECWQYVVQQVIGPRDALLSLDDSDAPPIWLTGYPTAGLVDDQMVRLVGPVVIEGTQSYTTPLGTNSTVRKVQFLERDKIPKFEAVIDSHLAKEAEVQRQISEGKIKGEQQAVNEARGRIWTDVSGKHTVRAVFVEFEFQGSLVKLERVDNGTIIGIPMANLSKDDQTFVREELKSQREAKSD